VQTGPTVQMVKGDYKGVIHGMVVWGGASMDLAGQSAEFVKQLKAHKDSHVCAADDATALEKQQQAYRIGANKGLGNVFVWIDPPAGQAFGGPDEVAKQVPKEVVISQPHCVFLPHCSGVFAARYKDGKELPTPPQVLVVQNDAATLHNAKVEGGA